MAPESTNDFNRLGVARRMFVR